MLRGNQILRREFLILAGGGLAAGGAGRAQEKSALPRVLIIGDSISIGYTDFVRKLLQGKAEVARIPVNGGPTTYGLVNIQSWLGGGHWDVIHFNWGLHDIKLDPAGRKRQVPITKYEENLRLLVKTLKATGARLIWANTTPVPPVPWTKLDPPRSTSDVPFYNAVAKKVMDENGIPIDDLYSFALPRLEAIQQPSNVHFTEEGYRELAEQVAASITAALEKIR